MNIEGKMANRISIFIAGTALFGMLIAGCAGGSLTTREKGAGIGALGGAAAGGIIGSAVHHPGAGAAIGGLLRSEEHTSELQSPDQLVCRPLLETNNI